MRIPMFFAVVALFALPAAAEDVCAMGKVGSLRICQKSCNDGDMEACTTLGILLYEGRDGAAIDTTRAVTYWRRACQLSNFLACARLGRAEATGVGTAKNLGSARRYLQQACDAGESVACAWYGGMLLDPAGGVPADPERAKALFEANCTGDIKAGCVPLGLLYERGFKGRIVADPARALSYFMESCTATEVEGCAHAGRLHLEGRGTPKDPAAAVGLFQRACGMNDPRSCTELGKLHRDGLAGVDVDGDRARALFDDACRKGEQHACVQLGWMHLYGRQGLNEDPLAAFSRFNAACEAGEASGCSSAGWMLAVKVEKRKFNPKASPKERAAFAKNKTLLEMRRQLPANKGQGLALVQRGCSGGDTKGCERMKTVGQWAVDE